VNTPNGRIFAGLMRGLLPTHERQDVAATAETSTTGTGAGAGDLTTEVLGEQINVITTTNAQPDPDSLSAFAKAQGLDEAAVKALFGDLAMAGKAPADAALPPNMTIVTDPAAAPSDVAWLASQLSAEISFQVGGVKAVAAAAQVVTDDAAAAAAAAATATATATASAAAAAAAVSAQDLTPTPVLSWNLMVNPLPLAASVAAPLTDATDAHTLSVSLPSPSGWGASGLNSTITPLNSLPLASTPGTDAGQVLNSATLLSNVLPNPLPSAATLLPAKPTSQTPVTATEGLDLLAPTAPQPQDAMRIRLVPAWSVVTQQLTQMSGTAMTSTWGALTAATLGAPTRSVALDLSTPLASDSEDGNSLNATDGGWSGAAQDLNRPGAASTPLPGSLPTPGMAQTLRQEHYQQLADRLGQAMAERLQSQIARGEWKLQMRLNPANLGRIDVELDMHAKGLDAMFRSENPLTRELMVQSMPKLKDTLSQSGMAVASVWVNSDAGRQSDGNPTPQKDRTDVTDTPKSAPADNGVAPATKAQRSTDGFDVLA
jgi:flagellar hook-length control protein FliK